MRKRLERSMWVGWENRKRGESQSPAKGMCQKNESNKMRTENLFGFSNMEVMCSMSSIGRIIEIKPQFKEE